MSKETFKKDFLVFFFLRGLQGALVSSIITSCKIRNSYSTTFKFGTDKQHIRQILISRFENTLHTFHPVFNHLATIILASWMKSFLLYIFSFSDFL